MTTITDTIEQWTTYRAELAQAGAIAASTFKSQSAIARVLELSFGHIMLGSLRKSVIDLFVARRLQNHKPVTVHGEIVIFRQILNWAIDEKLLDAMPRFPTVSVPNIEQALPSNEDFLWYLVNLPQKHSDALEFMLLTGLAPHELERLQTQDYDEGKNEIHIGYRPDFFIKQASRRRAIPLNHRATGIWWLRAAGKELDYHPFPKSAAIQKAMRRLFLSSPAAPIAADGLTPKMMRKWFASVVAKQHAEEVLQRLLGHAPGSPITRRHYVRSTDAEARVATDAVRMTPPVKSNLTTL